MKTSVLARVLCLMLMLCMVVAVFASCSTEDEEVATTTTEDTTPNAPTDEDGYVLDNIPEDLNLGREVKILYSNHLKSGICVAEDEIGDNVVNRAVYTRWTNVEDRLGAEINWIGRDGE